MIFECSKIWYIPKGGGKKPSKICVITEKCKEKRKKANTAMTHLFKK